MTERKFHLGQMVRLIGGTPLLPKEDFEVAALMPATERDEPQYRIRSSLDSRQRMVKETDIGL